MFSKLAVGLAALTASLASASFAERTTPAYPHAHAGDVSQVGNFLHAHNLDRLPPKGRYTRRQNGGQASLNNRCNYDVWFVSVDQNGSSELKHLPARTRYTEPFRSPCPGCGVVLKVSRTAAIEQGTQTQFEYAIDGNNQVWFNLSFVDCAKGDSAADCPGWDRGLSIDSPEPACQWYTCPANAFCPDKAYYVPQPLITMGVLEPVATCPGVGTGMTLDFELCYEEPAL